MTAELEALERWARALGILRMDSRWADPGAAWMVSTKTLGDRPWPHGGATVWYFGDSDQREAKAWDIDPLTALLWANAVESGVDGLALLVCEAAPKPGGFDEYVEDHGWLGQEPRKEWYPPEPGDPAAREALAIEADRLQSQSAPPARGVRPDLESRARSTEHLGVWLSAWLRGECPACQGHARKGMCDCDGHGVLLGAHVDAMIEALR